MTVWITMTITALLMPVLLIIFGISFRKNLPGRNRTVGFRTKLSMSSDEAWEFANKKCADMWLKTGPVMAVIALAAMFFVPRDNNAAALWGTAIVMAELVIIIVTIVVVENQLKKKFSK